jgi:hypothetical protein
MILRSLADVRGRLPVKVNFQGREFCIIESDGELIAYWTLCPHLLGPLAESSVRDGIIEYRFGPSISAICVEYSCCWRAVIAHLSACANSARR